MAVKLTRSMCWPCFGVFWQADSGGPLMVRDPDRVTIVGVISTGIGCAQPKLPGLYTRLSNYSTWIKTHVQASWRHLNMWSLRYDGSKEEMGKVTRMFQIWRKTVALKERHWEMFNMTSVARTISNKVSLTLKYRSVKVIWRTRDRFAFLCGRSHCISFKTFVCVVLPTNHS